MSYAEVMNLPIQSFWFMSDQIERVQSSEDQRRFRVSANAYGGDGVKDYLEELSKSVGQIYVLDKNAVIAMQQPEKGAFDDLRSMAAELTGAKSG